VADRAYYRALQDLFDGYDALLYEMVKPKDVEIDRAARSDSFLSLFQRGLKQVLGLEFQLDALDYARTNFVHADLDPETFLRLQRQKGENVISLLFKVMAAQWKRQARGEGSKLDLVSVVMAFASDDSARALKFLLARELKDVEDLLAGFEGGKEGQESVLLGERNKEAIRVLREEIDAGKKKLGIFYGAGHMPDLERRLVRDLGLRQVSQEWRMAWEIKK
jgi:hypothetical protein